MNKPKRYYATSDEAIRVAKQRASGAYRTQYIYRIVQNGKELFYIRGVQKKDSLPIIKVFFDGTVQDIRVEEGIVHATNR
jgi:hypothetical protein